MANPATPAPTDAPHPGCTRCPHPGAGAGTDPPHPTGVQALRHTGHYRGRAPP